MRKRLSIKKRSVIFGIFLLALTAVLAAEGILRFPSRIHIFEGETLDTGSASPYTISVPSSFGGVLEEDGSVNADGGISSQSRRAEAAGSYDAEVKLFGVIPVRSIHVDVHPQRELVPCGNTIGIKIFTRGLVCVGTSELKSEDGRIVNLGNDYDIREGDILLSANDTALTKTEQLAEMIASTDGAAVHLEISRGGKSFTRDIPPIKTPDGYRLGLWVRDSTAGIGTLTFYDADTNQFGALGHPITDADTGTLMPISEGCILNASVFSVKKGERGEPGELKGIFQSDGNLGSIEKNTKQGVFGTLNPQLLTVTHQGFSVASRSQVKEGAASILCCIEGETAQKYQIEIQRVLKYGSDNMKDLVIKVTDPVLLEKTGGIVQGMSGSVILQDNKIVGAVTHVFVNDPTRGYGIFIDNMAANLSEE